MKLATHNSTNCRVAVKIYEKFKLVDTQRKKSVMREVKILQKISHPNILDLYEAFDSPKQVFLITEFVEGKAMGQFVKEFSNLIVPEEAVK